MLFSFWLNSYIDPINEAYMFIQMIMYKFELLEDKYDV